MKKRTFIQLCLVIAVASLAASCGGRQEASIEDQGNGSEQGSHEQQTNETTGDNTNAPILSLDSNEEGSGPVVGAQPEQTETAQVRPETGQDPDGDGKIDPYDNCSDVNNPDQKDTDGDGLGDACDNCPFTPNASQEKSENTAAKTSSGVPLGKACDTSKNKPEDLDPLFKFLHYDGDGDSFADAKDNCPAKANFDQADADGDGVGDACDNCPTKANKYQTDTDNNEIGDACEDYPAGPTCTDNASCEQFSNGTPLQCVESKPGVKICACDKKQIKTTRLNPNIMFVLDRSGSMSGNGESQLRAAMNSLADSLYNDINFGIMYFDHEIKIKMTLDHYYNKFLGKNKEKDPTAQDIKNIWNDYYPRGATYIGRALKLVYDQNLLSAPSDPHDSLRAKVVLLITDGDTFDQNKAEIFADMLYKKKHIPVYVVGVGGLASQLLTKVAQEGGTKTFFTTKSQKGLRDKLKEIATDQVSCEMSLDNAPKDVDFNKLWVTLGGKALENRGETTSETNGFTFSTQKAVPTITIVGDSCTSVKNGGKIDVVLGCASECTVDPKFEDHAKAIVKNDPELNKDYEAKHAQDPRYTYAKAIVENPRAVDSKGNPYNAGTEWCDGKDNNCDGTIDEGCDQCSFEKCGDGLDNDCDGKIDNGCNSKKLIGQECNTDEDCFVGKCDPNTHTCVEACRQAGWKCGDGDECCDGVCSGGTCPSKAIG